MFTGNRTKFGADTKNKKNVFYLAMNFCVAIYAGPQLLIHNGVQPPDLHATLITEESTYFGEELLELVLIAKISKINIDCNHSCMGIGCKRKNRQTHSTMTFTKAIHYLNLTLYC